MEKEKLDQVMSPDVLKEGKEQILLEKGSLLMLDHVPRCVNDYFFPLKGDADVIVGLTSRNVFFTPQNYPDSCRKCFSGFEK